MAARRCCSRAPATRPDTCSRPVPGRSPIAAPARSIISTQSRAGALRRTARSNMSTRDRLLAVCLALFAACGTALALGPDLGRGARADDIAAWDISVGPDGAGLPPGSGTPQQGEVVFVAKCLA